VYHATLLDGEAVVWACTHRHTWTRADWNACSRKQIRRAQRGRWVFGAIVRRASHG
jgi:hypothetical protein